MEQVIGTCSECGGPVVLPSFMVNPYPVCKRCGAAAQAAYGPVIPMTPRKPAGGWAMNAVTQTVKRWSVRTLDLLPLFDDDWTASHRDPDMEVVSAKDYTALERRVPKWQPIETHDGQAQTQMATQTRC